MEALLAGKCDDVTGRFFRPRVSEEFYDTEADFHNIDNLIDHPDHQKKIARLRGALREKQLELYDSGLLPEAMRLRRAEANEMTIYEMVRTPKLYPLEEYLDLSDLALSRDAENLPRLVQAMSEPDEGIRYWAICGLFLLEGQAAAAMDVIERALQDESDEVKMMAAWTMHKLGHTAAAQTCFEALSKNGVSDKRLFDCILRWMARKEPGNLKS